LKESIFLFFKTALRSLCVWLKPAFTLQQQSIAEITKHYLRITLRFFCVNCSNQPMDPSRNITNVWY